MPSLKRLNEEALKVTRLLERISFADCLPITRKFTNISITAGIYAFKHRSGEILYVGKAASFRTRFKGHQTLIALYVDQVPVTDVRIALAPLTQQWIDSLEDIEKRVVFALQPRYNERIPTVRDLEMLQLKTVPPAKVSELLAILPDAVQDAIFDYAATSGLTEAQILELALAQFLDLDAVSFGAVDRYPSLGALQEENKILRTLLKQSGEVPDDAAIAIDLTSPESE